MVRLKPPAIGGFGPQVESGATSSGPSGDSGSGIGSAGDGGNGVGSGDGRSDLFGGSAGTTDSGGDDYVRDANGNIKRNKDGSPRRKRGRKSSGSAPGGSREKVARKDAVENLTGVLMALHIGIAQVAKAPEMILEEGEAKMLADPLARIAEDFDFVPDPRIMNAIALIGAAGMVYGPRIVNIRERLKEEAKAKRPPGQVINFPPLRSAGKTDPQPVPDPKAPPMAQTEPPPIDPALDAANGFRHIPPELNA